MLVDTEGFVLKAKVHSAKIMDYEGIKLLLEQVKGRFSRLSHLWLDAGYTRERIKVATGWKRLWDGRWISSNARANPPRKRFSEEVGYRVGQGRGEGRLAEAYAA